MEFLILESFIKSVPKEKKDEVSNCMKKLSAFQISDIQKGNIPSGYKIEEVKSIKNKNIYKLRSNRENRVLFTYGKFIDGVREDYSDAMVLLSYSNHDNQIKKASRITLGNKNIITLDELEKYVDYTEDNKVQDDKKLELSINNIISVVANESYIDKVFNDKRLSKIYYLDDAQIKAAEQIGSGKMLFGSAGSGKTTISLYKMIKIIEENIDKKICYITYSNVLKKNTKENFEIIAKNLFEIPDEYLQNVEFYTLEEYMIKNCNVHAIASFESFNNWYEENIKKYKLLDIPTIKVWREIRGVITGIIGNDLFNDMKIPRDAVLDDIFTHKYRNIKDEFISEDEDLLFSLKQGKGIGELKDAIRRIDIQKAEDIYSYILNYYIHHLERKKILEKDEYKNLSKFTCIEKEAERVKIYDIAKRYFDYINTSDSEAFSNFVAIENIQNEKSEYDYLIIDEMQDLTERELFYLMTIVKDKRNIFFTGDFNQTINPTYFDAGRVEGIYRLYAGFENLDKSDCISRNYRSVDKVVNVSNCIVKKRNEIFVNRRREFEYIEESVRCGAKDVLYVEGTKNNKDKIMEAIKADYSSIIIVSDNNSKDELIKKYPFIDDRIYTVSESKGIESKKVILYNIISDEKEIWDKLLKEKKVTDDSLRYYFNSLYVSITRAREELIFIEESKGEVFNIIKDIVVSVKDFDANKNIVVSTDEEILEEAKKKENEEFYDHAIKIYTKLLNSEYREEAASSIQRCRILEGLERTKESRIAINSLIEIDEFELAKEKAVSFNIADLYLKSLILNTEVIIAEELDRDLKKKFKITVPELLQSEQEIDFCDLVIEKYYGVNLSRLNKLLLKTKKLTTSLKEKV